MKRNEHEKTKLCPHTCFWVFLDIFSCSRTACWTLCTAFLALSTSIWALALSSSTILFASSEACVKIEKNEPLELYAKSNIKDKLQTLGMFWPRGMSYEKQMLMLTIIKKFSSTSLFIYYTHITVQFLLGSCPFSVSEDQVKWRDASVIRFLFVEITNYNEYALYYSTEYMISSCFLEIQTKLWITSFLIPSCELYSQR